MNKRICIYFVLFFLTMGVQATTWFPVKHTCPVCKHENEFQEIGSYGGYIYQWPSKFQYVYWPLTDSPSVYCCPDCSFSTLMWDFDSIPADRIDTLSKFLLTVKPDKKYSDYLDIPMITRLEIAEGVYKILGRDTEFWCRFYRVMGYHYAENSDKQEAKAARLQSLGLARQMIKDTAFAGQERENYFIMAAMFNYTGQKDSASVYLDKADATVYQNKDWKEENLKGFNEYLTGLISQYREFIKKDETKE